MVAMVLLAAANIWAQGGGYKIVVNPSNPATSMSKDEVDAVLGQKSQVLRKAVQVKSYELKRKKLVDSPGW